MSHPQPFVDPRGQRFAAVVTSVVLAASLVTSATAAGPWILAVQAVVFVIGAGSLARHPYGLVFRRWVRPRLGAPTELEDAAAPRFAQLVGAVFAVAGLVGYVAGAPLVGQVATGLALVAALLNAAVGLCLGCELHLLIVRALGRPVRPRTVTPTAG